MQVQCLKAHLTTIHRFLHPVEEADKRIELSDVNHALTETHEFCEDIDLARDLHQIGGFDIMKQCLDHANSGIR